MDNSINRINVVILMKDRGKIVGLILFVIGLIILFIGGAPLLASLAYLAIGFGAEVSPADIVVYVVPTIIGLVLCLISYIYLRRYFV